VTEADATPPPHLSVVIPVYRAEDCLEELYRRLVAALTPLVPSFEIVLVEDCGGDRSWDVICGLAARDARVRGIQFSRNFGQHYGITAGLDASRGDWVVIMDCDLQDQPEEIATLYRKALEGFDVVLAKRMARHHSLYRRLSSAAFYLVFNYLTGTRFDKEVAGFCILSRSVVRALGSMREADRFLMGLVQWAGFPTAKVEVTHAPRFSGETSYTLGKLLRLAWDTSLSYSRKPLSFSIKLGFAMALLSVLAGSYILILALVHRTSVPGWASLAVALCFMGGLIIGNLGIVAIYLGKVLDQTKMRPLYIVRRTTGEPARAVAPGNGAGPRTAAGGGRRAGHVFWITGLVGSGKTTTARAVHDHLRGRLEPLVFLDGDVFRAIMGNDLGYDLDGRLKNARRISAMCKFLSDEGIHVVCATQSLFTERHRWNRENIRHYHEVYLRVSPETLRARNQKGLVSQAHEPGGATGLPGVNQPYDEPERPDLVLATEEGGDTPDQAADKIVRLLDRA
jgi:dolichol-phosphate mannosyltransferase